MSENNAAAGDVERQFGVQRIYVKDISFESPSAPRVFTESATPEINVNMGTQIQEVGEDHFEVVLTVTVTAKTGDQTTFVVEVQQAGIFLIKGLSEEEMGPVMGIHCPNILFPFARETVSDLVTRGSFPQFLLAPVNFEALYVQQRQQQESEDGVAH